MSAGDRPILRLGHSPDPDDAFMWWPLFELDGAPPRLDTGRFRYEPVQQDIESLNERAERAELEITAASCAQYPRISDRYVMTACGSSLGEGYGPKLVARAALAVQDLRRPDVVVAVPGERTSAFAATSLLLGPGSFRHEVVDFDRIIECVASGMYDAGLVIHEGQLTYEEAGLHLVEDVGRWWTSQHGLPLPLGINLLRRDLEDRHGSGTLQEVARMLLESVRHALEHREESLRYALQFARGLDREAADEFVGLYVNRWTIDFGADGLKAVRVFLGAVAAAGLVADPGPIDFVATGSE